MLNFTPITLQLPWYCVYSEKCAVNADATESDWGMHKVDSFNS